ncbi:MAG: peptidylprolyl isomerase, partial [Planctomycetota bacterium]
RRRIDAGEPFGEIAVALSTDPSAARGGMVNPVSRFDTSWPAAFRQAVWVATPGAVTAPVLVGDTYVIAKVEQELPVTPPKDAAAARAMAERDTRRAQERVQMETLVAGLRQAQRDATILDESLKDAWSRVRNAAR